MSEPSKVRARLANELLRLRDLAGLSGRELARRLDVSQPTMSRIDRAVALPPMPVVKHWLEVCNADHDTIARVLALAEAAHGETRPWADLLGGRLHFQDVVRAHDSDATLVRNFQPTVIPGLLQTAQYARSILSLGRTDVPAAVTARLEYQQVLHQPDRRFTFLIAERALTWEPTPGALTGQMDKIVSLAALDSVAVAVLPADVSAGVVPWHNFVIRDLSDGGRRVTTELMHGLQEINDMGSVELYESAWSRLLAAAATGDDALELIRAPG